MSNDEIKDEIMQMLNKHSEKELLDLLFFLKQINHIKKSSIFNISSINEILDEDKGLLEKIAQ